MNLLEKFIYQPTQSETVHKGYASWIIIRCPYEVDLDGNDSILRKDVDDLVEGKWSSYYVGQFCIDVAYFELETDAMAFKLKFL